MKTGTIPEVPNSPTSSIGNSTASFDVTQSCDLKNNPRYQLDQWTDMPILYISLHKDFFVSLSRGPYPFKKLHVLHCVNPALIHFLFNLNVSSIIFSLKWIVKEGDPTWTVTLGKNWGDKMLTCDVDTLWFSEDEESAGKRKQLDSDNDSSDSEDENDGTWTENGTEKKIKKKKKPKGKVSDSESNDSDSVSHNSG